MELAEAGVCSKAHVAIQAALVCVQECFESSRDQGVTATNELMETLLTLVAIHVVTPAELSRE